MTARARVSKKTTEAYHRNTGTLSFFKGRDFFSSSSPSIISLLFSNLYPTGSLLDLYPF